MPRLRNIRHERFCYEFIKTGNRRQAYEAVYDPDGTRLRPNVAKTMGWQLLNLYPEVPKRIEEIRVAMQKKSDITIEKILSDYQYALDIAKSDGKPDSIVNAATAQAKLVGLLKDRIVNEPSEIEQMENISDILERVGQEAGADVALALAKAFGIEAPEPKTIAQEQMERIADSDFDIGEPPTGAVN